MNDIKHAGPVLVCRNITRSYRDGQLSADVLKGVDLSVNAGETVAIVGASGCGKSTLLHILGGLDKPTAGEVEVTGEAMHALSDAQRGRLRNRAMGFIYQFHHLLPEFSAVENVAMPLVIGGKSTADALAEARRILGKVGLEHRLEHRPGELSGGERQRAAVARALVTRPACVLGDEPTGNLDERTAAGVVDMMLELNRDMGTSLVLVTHDRRLARRMGRMMELAGGVLHELDSHDPGAQPSR